MFLQFIEIFVVFLCSEMRITQKTIGGGQFTNPIRKGYAQCAVVKDLAYGLANQECIHANGNLKLLLSSGQCFFIYLFGSPWMRKYRSGRSLRIGDDEPKD
jgi:hypothetical protein